MAKIIIGVGCLMVTAISTIANLLSGNIVMGIVCLLCTIFWSGWTTKVLREE